MLTKSGQVFGWPNGGYPSPQGPFYCGVGSESVYGRPLAEAHMDACIKVPTFFLLFRVLSKGVSPTYRDTLHFTAPKDIVRPALPC